jgi:type IV pilus biogenesis protein CpaD/CtpE
MKLLPVILISLGCVVLSACNQYLERKDTLTFAAGDAVASTAAVQIADPWPKASRNTNIPMDGVKAQRAMQTYRGDGAGQGAPPPSGEAPSGGPPSP